MIYFNNMEGLDFRKIDFELIETSGWGGPLSSGFNKFLKREEYDLRACSKRFLEFVGVDRSEEFQFNLLINVDEFELPEVMGFNYLKTRQIEAFQFSPSNNFDTWIRVLLDQFSATQSTILRHGSHAISGNIVKIKNVIENSFDFFERYAPPGYFESKLLSENDKVLYIQDNQLIAESNNFSGFDSLKESSASLFEDVEVFEPYGFHFDSLAPLDNFPNITTLNFDKCTIVDFSKINAMVHLEKLAFCECNFDSELRLTGAFPELSDLIIGYPTEVGNELLTDILSMAKLERLCISLSDNISEDSTKELANLTRLKRIQLDGVAELEMDFLNELESLESISLGGLGASALDTTFSSSILLLPNLKQLYLGGAQLNTDMDLSNLGKLEQFNISPWSDNNLEVLMTWESLKNSR